MQLKNTTERYGAVAQLLHWSIVVLIVTQFVLANQAEDAGSLLKKAMLLTSHKNYGMTVFMLAVIRLVWRLANPAPSTPETVKGWQKPLVHLTHVGLYVLIFATPLMGWMMSSAKNYSVSYFGLFTWPNLVAADPQLFDLLKTTHKVLAFTMANLALLHIAAALKHHFIDKDSVLLRMLPFTARKKS
jgi:cytochrome b561